MWLERTELVLGETRLRRLANARVAVIGLGGVGGAAAEALVRAGVGHMLFIDGDTVDDTNRNRQLLATTETVGMDKISAAEWRYRAINPDGDFTFKKEFYLPENSAWLYDWQPDYIIDAIDTVTAKLDIAKQCKTRKIRLIACLGTGNRLDPERLHLGDITETAGCGCPLAKVMRRELRRRGIEHLPVLFSTEEPAKAIAESAAGRHPPGSISFVPPVAGYIIAGKCIRDIIE
mgnify:FL=1